MKKIILSLGIFLVLGLEAKSLEKVFENVRIDGYLRGTYQAHDVKEDRIYQDDAIGGKLHFETNFLNTISMGASLYSSNALFHNDNKGLVPLRGESHKSYTILGEAYFKTEFSKSMLKIGRQEVETPFAQTDDIGMVPNSFEAIIFETHAFENTTFILGEIQKMAGVDAVSIDRFTNVNGLDNMQVLGIIYEGIENIILNGWYYYLKNSEVNKIAFLEMNYEKELESITYGMGVQYANENYILGKSANIYAGTVSTTVNSLDLTVSLSHIKVKNNSAFSGFGGGPFYANSEYLIIDNAGKKGVATWIGLEYDATNMGVKELQFGVGYINLENELSKKSTELDFTASYTISQNSEVHLVASKLKGASVGEDDAKHLRVFVNYNF